MGYVYTGFGAAAKLPALDSLSDSDIAAASWQKLYTLALEKLKVTPELPLSYVGQFYASVANIATSRAASSQGVNTLGELVKLAQDASPILNQVFGLLKNELGNVVGDMASNTGLAVGEAIPIVGAVVKIVADMFTLASASVTALEEAARQACQASYIPKALGTGYGGAIYPTDLIHGQLNRVLAQADQAGPFTAGAFLGKSLKSHSGIPTDRKKLLAALRISITKSRNDPLSDGGVALWPIYLDLLNGEFDAGHVGLDGVYYYFCSYVLPPYDTMAKVRKVSGIKTVPGHHDPLQPVIGDCCKYERRAFDELKSLLRTWKLTIDPIYVQDRVKAADLRKHIDVAEKELLQSKSLQQIRARPKLPIRMPLIRAGMSTGEKIGIGAVVAAGAVLLAVAAKRRKAS